jgi:heme exporter protein A
MTEHLKGGGIILAATHTPLGIAVQDLRIGGAA